MSAEDNVSKTQFERTKVRGAEVQVGDRLDSGGKHRVAVVHTRKDGTVLHRIETRGARSASVRSVGPDEMVSIYRKRSG